MKKTKRMALFALITVLVLNLSITVFAEDPRGPICPDPIRPDSINIPLETK